MTWLGVERNTDKADVQLCDGRTVWSNRFQEFQVLKPYEWQRVVKFDARPGLVCSAPPKYVQRVLISF